MVWMHAFFFFNLTWLSSIKDVNVICIDAYPNHRFLSFVLRSGLDIFIKKIAYAFVCVHECACVYRLSIWILKIHSYPWLKPNYAALTHSDRKGSFQMKQAPHDGVSSSGLATLVFPLTSRSLEKKKKTLVDRGLSSTRFHTCIFNQDYISQRSVTAHKCSRPFILEMYQCLGLNPELVFSLYKSGHTVLLFLQGKKK